MLAIKFKRQGKKHQASFRVVVAEKRSKVKGKFVDDLGWLDPHSKKFDLKKEKVEYWLKVGAKPTHSVHNLLVRAGVINEPKIAVHARKKKGETLQTVEKSEAKPVEAEVKKEAPAETPAAVEIKEKSEVDN